VGKTVFVKVGETSEVPLGSMKLFSIEGNEILVVNVNGSLYAIGGKCTHMGGDLSQGKLQGIIITCPRHGSRFDVTNGKALSGPKFGPIRLKTSDELAYPVKVEDSAIMVDVR
jgi:3-phenylpropionate/trans-cinnamate dioxygenase ferredoxin subunit